MAQSLVCGCGRIRAPNLKKEEPKSTDTKIRQFMSRCPEGRKEALDNHDSSAVACHQNLSAGNRNPLLAGARYRLRPANMLPAAGLMVQFA